MKIQLDKAGKRYNRDWIFKNLSYTFESGTFYAITGPNGSGKSTLLQAISGAAALNEGVCTWAAGEKNISAEKIYKHTSYCAPYLELIEEFTLIEFLQFHQSFKPFLSNISINDIITAINLVPAKNKRINQYSSGMKQRVKLAQCIFTDVDMVLLDEPCTNLDADGIELYQKLVNDYCKERLVIVSSNDVAEYSFCQQIVDITRYKK